MVTASLKGGDRARAYLRDLARKTAKAKTLKVGFLEGATYPDGTPVAYVAAIQEFGSGPIPPRSYFRTMIAAKQKGWPDAMAHLLRESDMDVARALAMMGEGIKGQLQQSIIDVLAPPLSAISLMLRKMKADDPSLEISGSTVGEAARRVAAGESYAGVSTKPLVESGTMLNAVDYEVSE